MLERGISQKEIHRATSLDYKTIVALADGRSTVPLAALQKLRSVEGEKLTLIGHRIMDSVLDASDEEIAKMPIGQRMVALGIAIDKRNLLEGLPTQRIELQHTDDAIDKEIARLEALIQDKLKVVNEVSYEVTNEFESSPEAIQEPIDSSHVGDVGIGSDPPQRSPKHRLFGVSD